MRVNIALFAGLLCAATSVFGEAPSKLLEYIGLTGQQYIDTGIVGKTEAWVAAMAFSETMRVAQTRRAKGWLSSIAISPSRERRPSPSTGR